MRAAIGSSWTATAALTAALLALAAPVSALEIVLHDVAGDRVERQRRYARGEVPLAGTPDLGKLDDRLKERGLSKGRAIFVRIFKVESELELWMQNATGTFTLLATYPICHWTGTIGPKLKEGDKQSPEGFYTVGLPQTRLVGRWRRAFNLGFPNTHDQLLSRTGSYILVHGGCSSVGCFAMTDQVQAEIFELADAALTSGQKRFHVQIFPFRMSDANMARFADHEWAHTWADLKPAYDSFERTHVPPAIALCGPRYKVADGLPWETGSQEHRLLGLKVPPNDGRRVDLASVTGVDGKWLEPQCRFDDESARAQAGQRAESDKALDRELPLPTVSGGAGGSVETTATLSTAAGSASLASSIAAPRSAKTVERSEPPEPAETHSKTRKASAPARTETASRSSRSRTAGEAGKSNETTIDSQRPPGGFGNATFRDRSRMDEPGG